LGVHICFTILLSLEGSRALSSSSFSSVIKSENVEYE